MTRLIGSKTDLRWTSASAQTNTESTWPFQLWRMKEVALRSRNRKLFKIGRIQLTLRSSREWRLTRGWSITSYWRKCWQLSACSSQSPHLSRSVLRSLSMTSFWLEIRMTGAYWYIYLEITTINQRIFHCKTVYTKSLIRISLIIF